MQFANTELKFLESISETYNFELKQAKQVYGAFGVILRMFQVSLWANHYFLPAVALARPWSPELVSSLMPNAAECGAGMEMALHIFRGAVLPLGHKSRGLPHARWVRAPADEHHSRTAHSFAAILK